MFLTNCRKKILDINYTSFKNEYYVDHDYHDTLIKVWSTMYNYQKNMEMKR